jgi:hypothetical protein
LSFLNLYLTARYKQINKHCQTLLSKATRLQERFHPDIEAPDYMKEKDDKFYVSNSVRTNLFILTLFTRTTDHGILYSPMVNYRSATSENLLDRTNFQHSMVDKALGSNDREIFGGNQIQILFYKEKLATLYDRDPTQILPCRMTSMSMESLKSGNLQVSQVLFKKQSLPVHPTQRDLLQLAFIFYLDIAKPDKEDKDQRFLDFSSILQAFTEETPRNHI